MSRKHRKTTKSGTDHLDTAALRQNGVEIAQGFGNLNIGTSASSIAFFFFLSIIPFLILASSAIPHLGMHQDDLVKAVTSVTPDIIDRLITSIIWESYSKSLRLFPFSIIILIWASSQGTMALMRALNEIYQVSSGRRNYFVLLPMSIVYTVILLIMLFFSVLLIFSSVINSAIREAMPDSTFAISFMTTGRYILAISLAILFFTVIYTFLPAGKRNFLHQLPGAMLTTVVWIIFSLFFRLYVNGTNRYTSFYGSLGTVAIFLFWLYCCFYILLIGGFVNSYFERHIRKLFPHRSRRRNNAA